MKSLVLASLVPLVIGSTLPALPQSALPQSMAADDFESGPLTAPWEVRSTGRDIYHVRVNERDPAQGARCVSLRCVARNPTPNDVVWMVQTVHAGSVRNRWLRLAAHLRVERDAESEANANLYVEVFGPGNASRAMENMVEREATSGGWHEYEVFVPVADDAELIQFGVGFRGRGSAGCDHIRLEALPEGEGPPHGPANLDFGISEPGSLPWSWRSGAEPIGFEGFRAWIPLEPEEAQHGVRLEFDTPPWPRVSGRIAQAFDARPLRGKLIRFGARVYAESEAWNDPARRPMDVSLLVARANQEVLESAPGSIEPEADGEWRLAVAQIAVPDDAEQCVVSVRLSRAQAGWCSRSWFEVLDPAATDWQTPAPLEGRALDNLVAFARLLGYVRFFHPSDQAEHVDWDAFAIGGTRYVEAAPDASELARRLEALFRPLAPTVAVFAEGAELPTHPALLAPGTGEAEVVAWRHRGLGLADSLVYESRRVREPVRETNLPDGWRNPAEPFQARLGGGVECRVPLTLYADAAGTLPRADAALAGERLPRGFAESVDDRSTRLAAVVLAWNGFQHCYP